MVISPQVAQRNLWLRCHWFADIGWNEYFKNTGSIFSLWDDYSMMQWLVDKFCLLMWLGMLCKYHTACIAFRSLAYHSLAFVNELVDLSGVFRQIHVAMHHQSTPNNAHFRVLISACIHDSTVSHSVGPRTLALLGLYEMLQKKTYPLERETVPKEYSLVFNSKCINWSRLLQSK